ncbi:MAG: hypothetical protein FJ245_07785 [Nitrospira sp.]|nr:hypothetical protein [Nitrospira sp.]
MNSVVRSFAIFALMGLIGCVTPSPSKQELEAADFGRFPSDYEARIKDYVKPVLYDSNWAQYDIGKPYKAAVYRHVVGLIYGQMWFFGYAVDARISDLNARRQYAGWRRFTFLFLADGTLREVRVNGAQPVVEPPKNEEPIRYLQ